jgi:diguanylate cyclase (GGDEF)-like protein
MALFDKKKLLKIQAEKKKIKRHIVMIVDDEEAHLRSISSLLSDDYYIITAKDGQEALDYIKKMNHPEKVSLIISDQRMPYLTGIELFEQLIHLIPNTIRILLTGYMDIPVIIDSVNRAKIYQFIPKPFDPDDFVLLVKRAIEDFELQKESNEYRKSLEQKIYERTQELEQKYMEIEKLSFYDQLTGLRNRRYLYEFIQYDIEKIQKKYKNSIRKKNESVPSMNDLIFFLLDMDEFKWVNDEYGHIAGDKVLKEITEILKKLCCESDIIVRFGGEEFLLVQRFTERDKAQLMAERLRISVEKHCFDLGDLGAGKTLRLTCSIGFAVYPFIPFMHSYEVLQWEQIVNIADVALYIAKKSGKNTWVGIMATDNTKTENLFDRILKNTNELITNGELEILTSMKDEEVKI